MATSHTINRLVPNTTSPSVIIIGSGMSGISAAKTLSDVGISNITIIEATDHIGGRICKASFADLQVEIGANWVEGVNGKELNPIWKMAQELNLKTFLSNCDNISMNCYKQNGGLYDRVAVEEAIDAVYMVQKLSKSLSPSGWDDISLLTMQSLLNHVPSDPLSMALDYYMCDYSYAEPPKVTGLKNMVPLPTYADFGHDDYLIADERGYETLVYHLAAQFLKIDHKGTIVDPRLMLNKVVRQIENSSNGVVVTTEDGKTYKADYVMVSVSIGVLQSNLIRFEPDLPHEKMLAIHKFHMAIYTKIFLKFPYSFWPTGEGTEFFVYASETRGYYPLWQHFEKEYPGQNILLVTVTDDESRRIEQQDDSKTKTEVMEVLKKMFGKDIPEATDILVPRWWSDRFYKGSFSNWPVNFTKYEFDQIKAPVDRVYFTGEHTSEQHNGYVHGAYIAGIDSANDMIDCIKKDSFNQAKG